MRIIIGALMGLLTVCLARGGENLLRNQDFATVDGKGRIADWQTGGRTPPTAAKGTLRMKIESPTRQAGRFCCRLWQNLGKTPVGCCELSIEYRGDLDGLFIVVRCQNQAGRRTDVLTKWLAAKQFIQAEPDGDWKRCWNRLVIPEDAGTVTLHLEAWGPEGGLVEYRNPQCRETGE